MKEGGELRKTGRPTRSGLFAAPSFLIIEVVDPVRRNPYGLVIGSAVLFGLSTPLAKLLLRDVPPLTLAGLLYLGAFLGLTVIEVIRRMFVRSPNTAAPLTVRDAPWLAGAVVAGGIIGPIFLLFGLTRVRGFSASLLLNLEGVATASIAVIFFHENAGRRLWIALAAMSSAGIFLAWDPAASSFAWTGVLLILVSMAAWGCDNNFTRAISDKNPVRIAQIKGLAAGAFSLGLALILGHKLPALPAILFSLAVGALSYGLSLVLYIRALSALGAFRAGAFFVTAPFVGALASFLILSERPAWPMVPGAALMILGVVLLINERHAHSHVHGRLVHAHDHHHDDVHHTHTHEAPADEPHSHAHVHVHVHVHEEIEHAHGHWPDLHHRHDHDGP